jgi:hypothetical protein
VVYIKTDSFVEKLICNVQERKKNKLGMASFRPNSQQTNIKKEHVDYNHHMLLIRQEIKERK